MKFRHASAGFVKNSCRILLLFVLLSLVPVSLGIRQVTATAITSARPKEDAQAIPQPLVNSHPLHVAPAEADTVRPMDQFPWNAVVRFQGKLPTAPFCQGALIQRQVMVTTFGCWGYTELTLPLNDNNRVPDLEGVKVYTSAGSTTTTFCYYDGRLGAQPNGDLAKFINSYTIGCLLATPIGALTGTLGYVERDYTHATLKQLYYPQLINPPYALESMLEFRGSNVPSGSLRVGGPALDEDYQMRCIGEYWLHGWRCATIRAAFLDYIKSLPQVAPPRLLALKIQAVTPTATAGTAASFDVYVYNDSQVSANRPFQINILEDGRVLGQRAFANTGILAYWAYRFSVPVQLPLDFAPGPHRITAEVIDSYTLASTGPIVEPDLLTTIVVQHGAPDVPTNLTATDGDGYIDLSWSPTARATTYQVYRANNSGTPDTLLTTTSATTFRYTVSQVTTAPFVVVARNDTGSSLPSLPTWSRTGFSVVRPPSYITASTNFDNAIGIAWRPSLTPSVAGYTIIRTGLDGQAMQIGNVTKDVASFIDRSAALNTTYTYAVQAFDGNQLRSDNNPSAIGRRLTSRSCTQVQIAAPVTVPPIEHALDAAVADFNGDGQQDIVVGSVNTSIQFHFLFNITTNGSALAFTPPVPYYASGFGEEVGVADLNQDGRPDLVVKQGNGVVFHVNQMAAGATTPAFLANAQIIFPNNVYPTEYAFVDLNRDGKIDIAAATATGVLVYINSTVAEATQIVLGEPRIFLHTGDPIYSLSAADVNRDGFPDLSAVLRGGQVNLLLNLTEVGAPTAVFLASTLSQAGASSVMLGDVTGDGRPDAVVGLQSGGLALMINQTAAGSNDAAFDPYTLFPTTSDGSGSHGIGLGDINGDGRADLLLGSQDENGNPALTGLLASASAATFVNGRTVSTGIAASRMRLADLDGDGRLDVLLPDYAGNQFSYVLNQTSPTQLQTVLGSGQSAVVNQEFAEPLQVRAVDGCGLPVRVTVTLEAADSGSSANVLRSDGGISGPTALCATDADGVCVFRLRANARAGSHQVRASIVNGSGSALFALLNQPGAAAVLGANGNTQLTAAPQLPFNEPLQVIVRDDVGNPVPGTQVVFRLEGTGAGATLTPVVANSASAQSLSTLALTSVTVTTNATGMASVQATANDRIGQYRITATIADTNATLTFDLANSLSFSIYLPSLSRY